MEQPDGLPPSCVLVGVGATVASTVATVSTTTSIKINTSSAWGGPDNVHCRGWEVAMVAVAVIRNAVANFYSKKERN